MWKKIIKRQYIYLNKGYAAVFSRKTKMLFESVSFKLHYSKL